MPAKKTTVKETEPVKAAAAAPAKKKTTVKSTQTASKPAVAPVRKSTTAAATHKAPARKKSAPKAAAAAAAVGGEFLPVTAASAVAAFDASLYREEIEREAYYLWINRGAGDGTPHNDWFEATEIVRRRYSR